MTDILSRIDAATDGICACGCGITLPADGPSGWWATESCQLRWQSGADPSNVARRAAAAREHAERRLARAVIHSGVATTYDPQRVAAAVEDVHRVMQAAFETIRPAFEQVATQLTAIAEQVRRLRAVGVLPQEPPVDPMERALWLRRNRNTGPKVQQRVPRRIDPKSGRR